MLVLYFVLTFYFMHNANIHYLIDWILTRMITYSIKSTRIIISIFDCKQKESISYIDLIICRWHQN